MHKKFGWHLSRWTQLTSTEYKGYYILSENNDEKKPILCWVKYNTEDKTNIALSSHYAELKTGVMFDQCLKM